MQQLQKLRNHRDVSVANAALTILTIMNHYDNGLIDVNSRALLLKNLKTKMASEISTMDTDAIIVLNDIVTNLINHYLR